jgi:hypothetical protein
MKNFTFKHAITFCFLIFATLFITSCGDDEVTGCTDPNAENYNPDADTNDNTCVYTRDKFIGEYVGSFACPGFLSAIDTDSIGFSIVAGLDDTNFNEVIITLRDVSGFDIPLTANASGNMLTDINAELLGIPVLNITSDVTGTGQATLSADGQTLDALVTLTVVNILGTNGGTCTLIGTKQ